MMDPTRKGMLQSVQAGAVRYGGCPVLSNGAHALKGEVMETLRVCDVDYRSLALR